MDQLDDSILGLFHMFSTIRALVKCDKISMFMYKLNKLKKWWVGWFVVGVWGLVGEGVFWVLCIVLNVEQLPYLEC
jgi:hypothetical protein